MLKAHKAHTGRLWRISSRHWDISGCSELFSSQSPRRALQDIERACGGTENSYIPATISIIIARCRDISARAPDKGVFVEPKIFHLWQFLQGRPSGAP